MSIFLFIGAIAIIFIIASKMGGGTKAENGIFTLNALSGDDGVSIILDKCKKDFAKGKIIIPSSVNTIGFEVMKGCDEITSLEFPSSVKVLGRGCFSGCSSIEELKLGEGVEKIVSRAFENCSAVKSVTFFDEISVIESNAFCGCLNINKITFMGFNPPEMFSDSFPAEIKPSCVVEIPKGSLDNYIQKSVFRGFENIVEI